VRKGEDHDAKKAETKEAKKRDLENLWRAERGLLAQQESNAVEEAIATEAIKRMGGSCWALPD
jgi:hypothetical protein